MMSNKQLSKIFRKQKRCQYMISNETGIEGSNHPTEFIGVCNAGLSNGLQEEVLLQETLKFGGIHQVIMIPNKSYCFLRTTSIRDAEAIYKRMHGISKIGQNDHPIYLAYFKDVPKVENPFNEDELPPGLVILKDFVTEFEEESLLKSVSIPGNRNNSDDTAASTVAFSEGGANDANHDVNSLKHRVVKHFGYEFLYDSNQVDPSKPLERRIPKECDFLWSRLKEKQQLGVIDTTTFDWFDEPDQLTVNHYSPGQGIPSHVDTHSAFLDPLLVISLEGDVVMEFKQHNSHYYHPQGDGRRRRTKNVLVPRRSLLIMSNESRFDWTHGITPRNMDIIPSGAAVVGDMGSALTVKRRQNRTSLTFRKLRRGPCTCKFPQLCDSAAVAAQKQDKTIDNNNSNSSTCFNESDQNVSEKLQNYAQKLEIENVHKVYDEIASHFSRTRHTPWPQVAEFLNSFDDGSIVLDVGCGNGKYLGVNSSTVVKIGCDRSEKLLNLCSQKKFSVFRCDCLHLPVTDNSIDGCISIAVIHHLATQERRLQAIKEMFRVLRSNGKCLIYVWAKNQAINSKKSNYLRQGEKKKNHNLEDNDDGKAQITSKAIYATAKTASISTSSPVVKLPVHVNRTQFVKQDVFVPWKLKASTTAEANNESEGNSRSSSCSSSNVNLGSNKENETFLRYYHVFEENELITLCKLIDGIEIEKSYYDEGNWCIIFRKI